MTDIPNPTDAVAQAMATALDMFSPIREARLGYRALLIAGGVSDLCADEMVVQFHGFTLALIQQASPA